jgi:hypothetical protein
VAVKLTCAGGSCRVTLKLTARGRHHSQVNVGSTHVTPAAGQTEVVRVSLNAAGRHLLAIRHALRVTFRAIQSLTDGHTSTINTQAVTLTLHRHKHQ